MPKNLILFLGHCALNLCRAADILHAGVLANALAVAGMAALQTGDPIVALWLLSFGLAFLHAVVHAIHEAWVESNRELRRPRIAPAKRRPTATKARRESRRHSKPRKAKK